MRRMKKSAWICGVIGVVLLGLALALVMLIFGGALGGHDGDEVGVGVVRMDEGLYGDGGLIELSGEEYNELVRDERSFVVVVRMEVCPAGFPVTDTVKVLANQKDIKIYSLKDVEYKKTNLVEMIKYLPTVVIVRDGEVVDFLDAEDDEDLGRYRGAGELGEWVEQYFVITL